MAISNEAQIPAAEGVIVGGGWSFGKTYTVSVKIFQEQNKRLYMSTAECMVYQIDVDVGDLPPTKKEFQAAADDVNSDEDYYKLFDDWGIYYLTGVKYGYKFVSTRSTSECALKRYYAASDDTKFGFEASVKVAKKELEAKTKMDMGQQTSSDDNRAIEAFEGTHTDISIGAKLVCNKDGCEWKTDIENLYESLMPIHYDMEYICKHPAFKSKKADCIKVLNKYCEHLKQQGGHDDVECNGDPKEPACQWDMDCDEQGRQKCVNPGQQDAKCEDIEQDVVWFPDGKPKGDWCGKIKHKINELIDHNNGCWTADDVHCQGGGEGDKERPFKSGVWPTYEDCNGGNIEIPPGVCVDLVPLWGAWHNPDACAFPSAGIIQRCATDKTLRVDFHEEALGQSNICAWRFYKRDPCLASSTVQLGNATEALHLIV